MKLCPPRAPERIRGARRELSRKLSEAPETYGGAAFARCEHRRDQDSVECVLLKLRQLRVAVPGPGEPTELRVNAAHRTRRTTVGPEVDPVSGEARQVLSSISDDEKLVSALGESANLFREPKPIDLPELPISDDDPDAAWWRQAAERFERPRGLRKPHNVGQDKDERRHSSANEEKHQNYAKGGADEISHKIPELRLARWHKHLCKLKSTPEARSAKRRKACAEARLVASTRLGEESQIEPVLSDANGEKSQRVPDLVVRGKRDISRRQRREPQPENDSYQAQVRRYRERFHSMSPAVGLEAFA